MIPVEGYKNLFRDEKTGAIVNPNMELLFNAPQLRPFAFTYRLSPRNREESVMVKKINEYAFGFTFH